MVGSNRGWVDVGYVPAPADCAQVARAIHWVRHHEIGIVPGISHRANDRVDVMRGEEVQIFGAIADNGGTSDAERRFCLPGTHCKWVTTTHGRITAARTAMTGEVFALLRDSGTLSGLIGPGDGSGFRAGLADAGTGGLLSLMFQARAHRAAGVTGARAQPDYISGLLIGDDVRTNIGPVAAPITIVGDEQLAALYAQAIAALGGQSDRIDGDAAFVAGIKRIWEQRRS
jgi:2-dehydro-3-deoxygalactonokinase